MNENIKTNLADMHACSHFALAQRSVLHVKPLCLFPVSTLLSNPGF